MIKPLFCIKNGLEYISVTAKVLKGDKEYGPADFISAISKRFQNEPEKLKEEKNLGFLTIAGYIMLEILHKTNPGICIDSLTTLEDNKESINIQQAIMLFATGVKIGQWLPKGIKIETETDYFDLRDDS